jgi:predicted DNA-binding transcriptional regulator AlpA
MALKKSHGRHATTPKRRPHNQKRPPGEIDPDALIGASEVRHLLNNCSEMHVWRLLNVESYAKLKFPKAIKINTRNYWRRRDIDDWIELQKVMSQRAAA